MRSWPSSLGGKCTAREPRCRREGERRRQTMSTAVRSSAGGTCSIYMLSVLFDSTRQPLRAGACALYLHLSAGPAATGYSQVRTSSTATSSGAAYAAGAAREAKRVASAAAALKLRRCMAGVEAGRQLRTRLGVGVVRGNERDACALRRRSGDKNEPKSVERVAGEARRGEGQKGSRRAPPRRTRRGAARARRVRERLRPGERGRATSASRGWRS